MLNCFRQLHFSKVLAREELPAGSSALRGFQDLGIGVAQNHWALAKREVKRFVAVHIPYPRSGGTNIKKRVRLFRSAEMAGHTTRQGLLRPFQQVERLLVTSHFVRPLRSSPSLSVLAIPSSKSAVVIPPGLHSGSSTSSLSVAGFCWEGLAIHAASQVTQLKLTKARFIAARDGPVSGAVRERSGGRVWMTSPASLNALAAGGSGVEKTVHLCLRSRLRIQSPFLVFDKLSSAAEDHTPASCRPQQKAIIIAILKCRERFHACIKDRQTAGDCELCALRPIRSPPRTLKGCGVCCQAQFALQKQHFCTAITTEQDHPAPAAGR